VDGPIWIKELGYMAPKMTVAQTSPKSERLSSEAILGIVSSFLGKPVNIKVGENFMPYNQDTEFALFGVRMWGI
jgi:hypothetical protein